MIILIDDNIDRFKKNKINILPFINDKSLIYKDNYDLSKDKYNIFVNAKVAFIHKSFLINISDTKLNFYDVICQRQSMDDKLKYLTIFSFSGGGSPSNLQNKFLKDVDLYMNIPFFISDFKLNNVFDYDILLHGKDTRLEKYLILREKLHIHLFDYDIFKTKFSDAKNNNIDEIVKTIIPDKYEAIMNEKELFISDVYRIIDKKIDLYINE